MTDLAPFGVPVVSGLPRCKKLPKRVFSCGFFCVLEMGIEGLMFSSFLLVLDFVVDFGRGFVALWPEFGVHELFSGSGVAGVVLRLRRRRGEGGNGAERRRQLCVISIDFCVPAGGGLKLFFF